MNKIHVDYFVVDGMFHVKAEHVLVSPAISKVIDSTEYIDADMFDMFDLLERLGMEVEITYLE